MYLTRRHMAQARLIFETLQWWCLKELPSVCKGIRTLDQWDLAFVLGLDGQCRTTVEGPCLATAGGMDGVFWSEFPWFLWALASNSYIEFHRAARNRSHRVESGRHCR